jgi:hypothetical protein
MVASGRAGVNQTNQRVSVEKRVVNPFSDENGQHFGVLRHRIEPSNEGDFVTIKRFFEEDFSLLFNFDETYFPALHGSLAHQDS